MVLYLPGHSNIHSYTMRTSDFNMINTFYTQSIMYPLVADGKIDHIRMCRMCGFMLGHGYSVKNP
jgi:hypothetical protein